MFKDTNFMRFKNIFILIFLISLITGCRKEDAGFKRSHDTLYRSQITTKVDHILMVPRDPKSFHIFLHEALGLPIAWSYMEYGSFASGAVFAGNVNLESIKFEPKRETGIIGLAFEPLNETNELIKELSKMKVGFSEPDRSYYGWTNTGIDLLDRQKQLMFFCDYKERRGTTSNNKKWDSVGPLGIQGVKYLSIETLDDINTWEKVLYPNEYSNGYFNLANGPDIKLTLGKGETIHSIVFGVKSLDKAKSALIDMDILGEDFKDIIYTDPNNTYGIVLGFTQEL